MTTIRELKNLYFPISSTSSTIDYNVKYNWQTSENPSYHPQTKQERKPTNLEKLDSKIREVTELVRL